MLDFFLGTFLSLFWCFTSYDVTGFFRNIMCVWCAEWWTKINVWKSRELLHYTERSYMPLRKITVKMPLGFFFFAKVGEKQHFWMWSRTEMKCCFWDHVFSQLERSLGCHGHRASNWDNNFLKPAWKSACKTVKKWSEEDESMWSRFFCGRLWLA